MSKDGEAGVRPLAVNKTRAAMLLGVSVDFFERHVASEVKSVRKGGLRLYAVRELEAWLDSNAEPMTGRAVA